VFSPGFGALPKRSGRPSLKNIQSAGKEEIKRSKWTQTLLKQINMVKGNNFFFQINLRHSKVAMVLLS
jgi:hypothetical protein